jgi:hypothetical protein
MPRPDDYPIPDYAVYMWIKGDTLCVGFPPTLGTRSHTVEFPGNAKGLSILLEVLRERSRSPKAQLKIGHKGEPNSYAIERAMVNDPKYKEWLVHMAKAKTLTDQDNADIEAICKELGL